MTKIIFSWVTAVTLWITIWLAFPDSAGMVFHKIYKLLGPLSPVLLFLPSYLTVLTIKVVRDIFQELNDERFEDVMENLFHMRQIGEICPVAGFMGTVFAMFMSADGISLKFFMQCLLTTLLGGMTLLLVMLFTIFIERLCLLKNHMYIKKERKGAKNEAIQKGNR